MDLCPQATRHDARVHSLLSFLDQQNRFAEYFLTVLIACVHRGYKAMFFLL